MGAANKLLPLMVAAVLCASPVAAKDGPDAGVIPATGTIELRFSPGGGAAAAVVRAIDAARQRVMVQAYSFTNRKIAAALVAAHQRGVDVQAVLDHSNKRDQYSAATFLANHGIPVRVDAQHPIAHNKLILIDDDVVITGSMNFTRAGDERNAENLLILRGNRPLWLRYQSNWADHWEHSAEYRRDGA